MTQSLVFSLDREAMPMKENHFNNEATQTCFGHCQVSIVSALCPDDDRDNKYKNDTKLS